MLPLQGYKLENAYIVYLSNRITERNLLSSSYRRHYLLHMMMCFNVLNNPNDSVYDTLKFNSLLNSQPIIIYATYLTMYVCVCVSICQPSSKTLRQYFKAFNF